MAFFTPLEKESDVRPYARIIVVTMLVLLSGCSTMKQSLSPEPMPDTANPLASLVSITPINAQSIKELVQHNNVPETKALASLSRLNWEYRIGPGDVLSIVVWGHPELTIPAGPDRTPAEAGNRVLPDGTIFYPYIGNLPVAGKTIAEAREAISRGLRSVIPRPQVDVFVAFFGSQRAMVAGAVQKAGPVPITTTPLTLLEAIEGREGPSEMADLSQIQLIRDDQKFTINLKAFLETGDTHFNPSLQDSDIIVVPQLVNDEVYVLGEVGGAQVIPLIGQPLTLTSAIASSGGVNKSTADARGIFVIRNRQETELAHVDVFQLDITNPTALIFGARFPLEQGDVVYITSSPAARWNRVIANLIPSLGFLNTVNTTLLATE